MVDSEYSTAAYTPPKISIRAIMKNPEFLITFKLKGCVNMRLKITFRNRISF